VLGGGGMHACRVFQVSWWGGRICIAWSGMGMYVHACEACLPSLLDMGDTWKAVGLVGGAGCGVFSLSARSWG
jgi:hypothetical protein